MFKYKLLALFAIPLLALPMFFISQPVSAHQSGCHRWHSCPSDSGSYTCGDTGYCSQCSNNYYCKNGTYSPGWQTTKSEPKPAPAAAARQYFIGVPRNKTDLLNCYVVGNTESKIYHPYGSSYIKTMVPKGKICLSSETDAKAKGYRKAK